MENGFGDLPQDFWTGPKLINTAGPSAEYPLTVAEYTGGSGDYFTTGNEPTNNARFTIAYDNDIDVSNDNGAVSFGYGWWYYRCFDINLNYQPPMSDYPTRVLFMYIASNHETDH